MFHDRRSAGEALAGAVLSRVAGLHCRVYGLARGGIVVARPVAERLVAPLDVLVACKVGAPGQPEYAVGAVAEGGGVYWDSEALDSLGLGPLWCERAAAAARVEVERRTRHYRGRPLEVDAAALAIVVDDGLATGSTVMAALRGLAALGVGARAVAVPVASREALELLSGEAEWTFALETPDPLFAVGAHYQEFGPVEDEELLRVLGRTA